MMQRQHLFFVLEVRHVEEAARFLRAQRLGGDEYRIIALNADVEAALDHASLSYISAKTFRADDAAPMVHGEGWVESLFHDPQWSFFSYREVSLSRLYFFPLQVYCSLLLYYADIVARVMEHYPDAHRYVVFSSEPPPVRGGPIEALQVTLLADTVALLAQSHGGEVVFASPSAAPVASHQVSFALQRAFFSFVLSIYHACITAVRRPRRICILASDYWKNLAPYVDHLDDAEIILLDRMEGFHAGWRSLWTYRMRFMHIDSFTPRASAARIDAGHRIQAGWRDVQAGSGVPGLLVRGVSLRPLVLRVLDHVVSHALSVVLPEIDAAYVMLARLRPDVVELRSTMSVQPHFVILAQVARALGIPSLEMQHGLEYYGPGSMDRRHSAEHMGVYGPLTERELRAAGDTIATHVVGSPRFDVYATLPADARASAGAHTGVIVLCIAPPIAPGLATDTYDIETYFTAVAQAARAVPQVSVIIKLRPGRTRQTFYESVIARAFEGVPHRIAQLEPLAELYPRSDIVVSCYSTALLEALQCGKPLIYLGLSAGYALMGRHHFTPYVERGAMALATTPSELAQALHSLATDASAREDMSTKAMAFLAQAYAFDGKASERAAALIVSLAKTHIPSAE